MRSACEIELAVEGDERTLPPGLDLAAYRVVQEALTNTVKHAGGARAAVTVAYGAESLELTVSDDGRNLKTPNRSGGGHGLVGMRERAAIYGGTLEAGPREAGGFGVWIRFPLERSTRVIEARRLIRHHWGDVLIVAACVAGVAELIWHIPWGQGDDQIDLVRASHWVAIPFVLLWTLPLLVRRRSGLVAGLTVFAAVAVLGIIDKDATDSIVLFVVVLAASATIGLHEDRRRAIAGGLVALVALLVLIRASNGVIVASDVFVGIIFALGPLAGGQVVRSLTLRNALLEQRTEELVRIQAEQAEAAVADERARIANELHDVIAQSVSVMTVQASGARMLLRTDRDRAREAILAVEETGREALAETRRLLGIMRHTPTEPQLAPQPGIGDLASLVERAAAAGIDLALRVEGEPQHVSHGVELVAYRVVSDACEFSPDRGGVAHGDVTLRWLYNALEIEVGGDGRCRQRRVGPPDRSCEGADPAVPRHARDREPRRRHRNVHCPHTSGGNRMIRVLIADDQALVRGGFRMILDAQPDMEVVGEAVDGKEAVTLARELEPDVVLMDIRMPELDGLEATRRLVVDESAPRVLMLTTFDMNEYVYEAMKSGASGFLLKDVRPEQLAEAVRTIAAGDALLAPAITRRLIEEFVRRPPPGSTTAPGLEELTERELEVVKLIARGLSNDEIGEVAVRRARRP